MNTQRLERWIQDYYKITLELEKCKEVDEPANRERQQQILQTIISEAKAGAFD